MKQFFEKTNEHGTFYEDMEGTIYQAYGNDETFPEFQRMLDNGEAEIATYAGSEKEAADNEKADAHADRIEQQWAIQEIKKVQDEAIERLLVDHPDLKNKFDSLKVYRDNPRANGRQRPAV